ncbi:MAG: DegV family protein [Candidatus Fimenecus sp.]
MSEFILSCCSTADMPLEFFQTRNVQLVCFHFTMDGTEYADDLGQSIPFDEFYQRIADGAEPTTSQVNVQQYIEFFEPFLKEGKDILHIVFSSGLSGSYNSACIARDTLEEQYPDNKIYLVDSLAASSGYGLLVDTAADMRDSGKSAEEIVAWLEENKLHLHHWFFSTDLTSYIRGGRVSPVAGFFGTMLKICPLLNVNNEGKLIPRQKCRGKSKAIDEIVSKMVEHAEGGLDYSGKCFISNSACLADAEAVASRVEETFKNLNGKVMINNIGTVIGSHTGPGTVALFFYGDERGE